ncbi:TetR/AcrR family transcriptional regulator [Aquidulcibacter sp.]|uniref:TetR/AcrR family transcriptional regulator n=1 Tax=Aquidulcibacter sp. TaxID=2052990 RepID=UPI0025BD0FEA|nr:TetR/AcrR family transcriptional regulator [Aquidulcibacter sp.]MCA3696940.1 TetR/AcrR family transcriptional regulator [Aquidulcibacter sp.]
MTIRDIETPLAATAAALGSKERLIAAALSLFQAKGYHGVAISDILDATSLPKGSLYHHFPGGKEELAIAAVAFISDEVDARLAAEFAKNKRAGAVLLELAHECVSWLRLSDYTQTPLLGLLAASPGESALTQAICDAQKRWLARFETALGGTEEAHDKACLALASLEGGISLARMARSSDLLIRSVTLAALHINQR